MTEGLQVVAVVRRGEGEAREDGGEQRGDGGLGGAEGEPAAAQEEEAQRHRDGHVEAVGHLARLRVRGLGPVVRVSGKWSVVCAQGQGRGPWVRVRVRVRVGVEAGGHLAVDAAAEHAQETQAVEVAAARHHHAQRDGHRARARLERRLRRLRARAGGLR